MENAPKEHAKALLAACDSLQRLRDRGLLELARGALGLGEKVLRILVETGNSPEVMRALQFSDNLIAEQVSFTGGL